MTTNRDIKTLMPFLAENPDADISKAWELCWNMYPKIVDRIMYRFSVRVGRFCACPVA